MYNTDYITQEARQRTLIAAHRGVSSANIPCNTIPAYGIALRQKADIVEIDVSRSLDGQLYAFHPGMEKAHLRSDKRISELTSDQVDALRFVNQDDCFTPCKVNTLDEVFTFLKDQCYINVDKFWEHTDEITACIRRHGMEKQVIVKTPCKQEYFDQVEKYAPDMAFMPVIWRQDDVTDELLRRSINLVGAEVLFDKDTDPVASPDYIQRMHEQGLVLWVNSIVYDSNAVISGHHCDDFALTGNPDENWGWLIDRGYDIIQTDWCQMLREYISQRKGS